MTAKIFALRHVIEQSKSVSIILKSVSIIRELVLVSDTAITTI